MVSNASADAMSRTAKILITIAASLVVMAVGVIGLAAVLWARHGRDLLDAGAKHYDEGVAFGQQTDEQGCLDQAITRYKANRGVGGSLATGIFVRGCWQTSRPTPGFCAEVPKPLDVLRAQRWQREQTRKAGVDNELGGQVFVQLRNYCAAKPATASPTAP
jgi:hypothetical protein